MRRKRGDDRLRFFFAATELAAPLLDLPRLPETEPALFLLEEVLVVEVCAASARGMKAKKSPPQTARIRTRTNCQRLKTTLL